MRRECRERFPRHRLQMKPLVSDSGMHHDTCVTHVPWCMSGSLTRSGGENVPCIPGACATRNLSYLARGLLPNTFRQWSFILAKLSITINLKLLLHRAMFRAHPLSFIIFVAILGIFTGCKLFTRNRLNNITWIMHAAYCTGPVVCIKLIFNNHVAVQCG